MTTKNLIIIGLVVIFLLLIPLVAMQFTTEVNWDLTDFVIMGILLSATGVGINWAITKIKNPRNRIIIGAVVLLIFLLIWAEMAVGLFGSPIAGS